MHGFENSDGSVYHKTPAWHGLGVTVDQAPTPHEALKIAGLDWQVEQWALSATDGESAKIALGTHALNVRSDNKAPLAVVGEGYEPIHNHQLAEFANELADQNRVEIESAGSIQGGRRVWFLCKGEGFAPAGRPDDAINPYVLIASSHDGSLAFQARPTSIRVVCKNTLDASLGRGAAYKIRHTSKAGWKIDEAKRALGFFANATTKLQQDIDKLAKTQWTAQKIQEFWLKSYLLGEEKLPANATTTAEQRQQQKAAKAFNAMARRFDIERDTAGATAWNAVNAFTHWRQHDRTTRGADDQNRRENKTNQMLFGRSGEISRRAFDLALAGC